ncbi:MAG: electron transfer flavoprotein subunit beta/FixA family protein [Clostridium sp.]|nr:electron transfer flavoprotein subunit beta/FixA family protein [Clostridium sp.]
MDIIVLLKQVPDTTEMKVDKETGTLIRKGVPTIINPDDLAGLELALRLKETKGANVTCVTMGPPNAENMLRELYARGADKCVLVTDRRFGGADTWATSNTLGAVIETMKYDLVIAGRQAIDGDTAQVGPQTAEKLGISQITYVEDILDVYDNKIKVKKSLEDTYQVIEGELPVLITTLSSSSKPRYMNVYDINHAFEKDIKVMGFDDIDIDIEDIGLKGSPTKVKKTFAKEVYNELDLFEGSSKEAAHRIFEQLLDNNYIGKGGNK